MSEWNVIHENFHTKHSALTAPDEHMRYIRSSRTSDQFIWLVSEKKTEAVNDYLIKKSKGEGVGGREKQQQQQIGGAGGSKGSRKDWAELYGCIKQVSNDQSLQWQSLENLSLSLPERDEKLELEL